MSRLARHRDHPFDEGPIGVARAEALGRRQVRPRKATVNTVGKDAHAVCRRLDLYFDKALEERGNVVVEDSRQPLS